MYIYQEWTLNMDIRDGYSFVNLPSVDHTLDAFNGPLDCQKMDL